MTTARGRLGQIGEAVAARFLEARGYRIVARNVRADRVEIDLVARRGSLLVIVEVKSRRSTRAGSAAEAVDDRKQRRLRRGARAWLATQPSEVRGTRRTRFDVVTCVLVSSDEIERSETRTATGERTRHDAGQAAKNGPLAAWAPDEATAPDGARWWIEHWEAAF